MDTPCTFQIAPATRFRAHEHDGPHLCFILDGGFVERDGRSWRDVGSGTVRISGAARHDIDFSDRGAVCLMFEVAGDGLTDLNRPRFIENDNSISTIGRQIQQAATRDDPARSIAIQTLQTELVAQILRRLRKKESPPPSWLARIREMIHDTPGTITLDELALEAGVHRVHLARTFRDHYGFPITAYRHRLRVQSALRMLAERRTPLTSVALEAGFADQSHLTRAVKLATGSTPGMIRESYTRSRPHT